jgi:GH25 family lysozyme M1 (1,4-beta-N-acetylmuramidase)
MKGIDVSKWQGQIDWHKVKKDGVRFVMARISHGTARDPMYAQNIEGAQAVGLPVGGYFYSYARSVEAARQEARTAIEALNGYRLTYPLAFDQEDARQQGLSKRLNTDMAIAALESVKTAGYTPALYSNPN